MAAEIGPLEEDPLENIPVGGGSLAPSSRREGHRAIHLKWTVELPRVRSVIISGRPKRVEFKRPLVFLSVTYEPQFLAADYGTMRLFNWSTLTPDVGSHTELYVSSVHAPLMKATHVYPSGFVCFGPIAQRHIVDGAKAVDVFWGSNMRILPSWMTASDFTDRVEPTGKAWPAMEIGPDMSATVDDACYVPASQPMTPELATRRLMQTLTWTGPRVLTVEAPWMREKNSLNGSVDTMRRQIMDWGMK